MKRISEMTEDEIRVAVAQKCGIEVCHSCFNNIDSSVCHCGEPISQHGHFCGHSPTPTGCTCGYLNQDKVHHWCGVPNYPKDLNACADMVSLFRKGGTKFDYAEYVHNLAAILEKQGKQWGLGCLHDRADAPPLQRCQAFLLTHGYKM